ncbi:BQ2448_3522 [Microbotryum intermedium]|uniref:BQ2448_3522 protein n=1 Tax=Microbotryum intermedium TaxID=269621 RepID=A0A238FA89_9BASI|nr:BQ2448_3522 [Microbotryum intermedium]
MSRDHHVKHLYNLTVQFHETLGAFKGMVHAKNTENGSFDTKFFGTDKSYHEFLQAQDIKALVNKRSTTMPPVGPDIGKHLLKISVPHSGVATKAKPFRVANESNNKTLLEHLAKKPVDKIADVLLTVNLPFAEPQEDDGKGNRNKKEKSKASGASQNTLVLDEDMRRESSFEMEWVKQLGDKWRCNLCEGSPSHACYVFPESGLHLPLTPVLLKRWAIARVST